MRQVRFSQIYRKKRKMKPFLLLPGFFRVCFLASGSFNGRRAFSSMKLNNFCRNQGFERKSPGFAGLSADPLGLLLFLPGKLFSETAHKIWIKLGMKLFIVLGVSVVPHLCPLLHLDIWSSDSKIEYLPIFVELCTFLFFLRKISRTIG